MCVGVEMNEMNKPMEHMAWQRRQWNGMAVDERYQLFGW